MSTLGRPLFGVGLCLCLALASSLNAQAETPVEACTSHAPAIVELALEGCRPGQVAIEDEIAGTRLWWLRPYLESVASGNPGVVVRGRIERSRDLQGVEGIGPWREGGSVEELFFTSSDPDFCGTFTGLETVLLLREEPCCDIIPPASVACVLDLFEVRSWTPGLQILAESPSLPVAQD